MNTHDIIPVNGHYTSISTLALLIQDAAEQMAADQTNGCYHWNLGQIEKNIWAICLGWESGYEPDENDPFASHNEADLGTDSHLAVKLAYQPSNSIMQCDYDVDWTMPYDPETGNVDDNEEAIYKNTNFEELAVRLVEIYQYYKKQQ